VRWARRAARCSAGSTTTVWIRSSTAIGESRRSSNRRAPDRTGVAVLDGWSGWPRFGHLRCRRRSGRFTAAETVAPPVRPPRSWRQDDSSAAPLG
jgi:hypothetical protein